MQDIKVLDCTLRDGGRLFDNAFGDDNIRKIIDNLTLSGIEYIEIGFLKFKQDISCRVNTTFFEEMDDMVSFIPKDKGNSKYLAMIENCYFEQDMLPKRKKEYVECIRLCVTKREFKTAKSNMIDIKNKGYELFVQCTDTLGYSDEELEEYIEIINEVKPYGFGFVDTYGAMNINDFNRLLNFVDKKLNKEIILDIHLHNNKELAFAFACLAIESPIKRECIIDSTLLGIGMGAGNLKTEMIVEYINSTIERKYDISPIVLLIDENIKEYKEKYKWGPSLVTFMGAEKKAYQLFISCVENASKDVTLLDKCNIINYGKTSLSKIDINRLVKKMNVSSEKTHNDMIKLKNIFQGRQVVLITRGPSAEENKDSLKEYIIKNNALVLYVNKHLINWFQDASIDEVFFLGTQKHFDVFKGMNPNVPAICYSDIMGVDESDYVLDGVQMYKDIELCSNDSTINALNMLKTIGWTGTIGVAGFDGGSTSDFGIAKIKSQLEKLEKCYKIIFLTESKFDGGFNE